MITNAELLTRILGKILELPQRIEPISGQNFKYVKLEDVVEILQDEDIDLENNPQT